MIGREGPSARAHAAREWAEVRERVASTTPRTAARAGLVAATIAGGLWIARESWPAVVPFIGGGLVAYMLLPTVDVLARFMPRALASFLAVVGVIAVAGLLAAVAVPPVLAGIVRAAVDLPTAAEVDAAVEQATASLGTPEGSEAAATALAAVAGRFREVLASLPQEVEGISASLLNGALGALGALIGLVVLPTWVLTVLRDKAKAQRALDQRFAASIREDAWAALRIVDRASGAYLRGFVAVAALVGVFTWIGLRVSPMIGGPAFQEPAALAVIAGASQLIPAVGGFVGLAPALLLMLVAPDRAVAYGGAYLAGVVLGSAVLGARIKSRRLGVPPAIMVPGIVMIGQFGLGWLLLSAPIVGIAHDLVRYLHGRLSEPPRPAGWLPGTEVPAAVTATPRSTPLNVPAPRQISSTQTEAATGPTAA